MLNTPKPAAEAIEMLMLEIGARARTSARALAVASPKTKTAALLAAADALERSLDLILAENHLDVERAQKSGMTGAFIDRLKLDEGRVNAIADGIRAVAMLDDPIGAVTASWERPNGLRIERVRTPLGVVGVIYESRPNVTADAGALCLKSGNAVILRGGSDSARSSAAIHAALVAGLVHAGLPEHAIQIVPSTDRAAVGAMLKGLDGAIDVIVPRGGKSLVARVQDEARVPVFAHLEGLCHVFVEKTADLRMAIDIIVNSKMRRTGVCGAAETLLVDRSVAATHLEPILAALRNAGCELRGTEAVREHVPTVEPAIPKDFETEYLDAIISVDLVDGVEGAIEHIERYSSHHTEAIVSEDLEAVGRFFSTIDSAILLHNASTQFADGGEFGMGAEIGIATGKMHARGPVGVEQLTSFNYRVRGTGQTRP